ncbi:MAG TPA: hypothetical protein VF801_04015, partial [Rhodocyclaceae bacterium]
RPLYVRPHMHPPTHTGPHGLAEFADECASALLSEPQYNFSFPVGCSLQNWPIAEIKAANEDFLKSLRGRANVYALFVRRSSAAQWLPVYVGERKSAGLRDRLTQHLITKHEQTGSMLEAVKTAVAAGEEIGISFIKVHPESLRLFVEETIIAKHKEKLSWNIHG